MPLASTRTCSLVHIPSYILADLQIIKNDKNTSWQARPIACVAQAVWKRASQRPHARPAPGTTMMSNYVIERWKRKRSGTDQMSWKEAELDTGWWWERDWEEWPVLLPMMSRPVIPPRAMSKSVSLPQLESMFMSMACPCYHQRPGWCLLPPEAMSVPCVTTKGHADAHGLDYHLRACGVWACAATESHV